MSRTRSELTEIAQKATTWCGVLDGSDAASTACEIVDDLIDELRRDPAAPKRTFDDWTVRLATFRQRIEDTLTDLVAGLGDIDEVVEAIVDELASDGEASDA